MNISNNKKTIWYPGSAYASLDWISHLQSKFLGDWLFSDINKFENKNLIKGQKIHYDTFSSELPDILNKKNINMLIMSWHSSLKTFEQIKESDILAKYKPNFFVYDPGFANIGNLEQHLFEVEKFKTLGYDLVEIVVLPTLFHQYSLYTKK